MEGQAMKKLSLILTRLYLRLRVKNANRIGTLDPTSGRVIW